MSQIVNVKSVEVQDQDGKVGRGAWEKQERSMRYMKW